MMELHSLCFQRPFKSQTTHAHRKGRWVAPDKFAGKNLTQQNRPKVQGRETVFSPSYRPEILTVAFSVRLISTIKISALLLG